MTTPEAGHCDFSHFPLPGRMAQGHEAGRRPHRGRSKAAFVLGALLLSSLVFAQGTAKISGVEPASGKVNDSVTVTGEGLGKGSVAAVFLSDDKSDYKAAIVDQSGEKIVMKVPQVKPGSYNVSILVGTGILIEPVRFTVQE